MPIIYRPTYSITGTAYANDISTVFTLLNTPL